MMTNTVPPMYQGVLFPNLVEILSEKCPTRGVVIASNIYPLNIAYDAY